MMRNSTTNNSNNSNNNERGSTRRNRTQGLPTSPRRRRSSTSPLRNRGRAIQVRSNHPNAGFVTPPTQQRLTVRDVFNNNSNNSNNNTARLLAPPLTSNSQTNNNNNTSQTSGGGNWLGRNALARPARRSATNNEASSNQNNVNPTNTSSNNNSSNNNTNTGLSSPRSTRSKLLKSFRQGSIGSFLGLDQSADRGNPRNSSASSTNNNEHPNQSHKVKALSVRRHHIMQMTKRLQQQHSKRYPHADVLAVLEFWRMCPTEVTLKMLAFLGPQLISKLQRTQRNVYHLLEQDVSWRVLCEELYKWRPGDGQPESWKEHYRMNPCVPVDFSSIGLALAVVGTGWTPKQYKRYCKSTSTTLRPEVQSDLTIWLRPDEPHSMGQAIPISTLRRTTQVTIQTMHTHEALQRELKDTDNLGHDSSEERSAENTNRPQQREECHPDSIVAEDQDYEDENNDEEEEDDRIDEDGNNGNRKQESVVPKKRTRALLRSKTRCRNEPLFRVVRGQLVLREVDLQHACMGVDIWNGNAAVQIQPTYLSASGSILSFSPSASVLLQNSSVTSMSGRGVVTVEGGHLICDRSYIHNCAATGVYVGGRSSCATLIKTDVWSNGTGNGSLAGGIVRGHSGVYIEQAKRVELDQCTVAYNTASGISMIGNPQQLDDNINGPGENIINSNMALVMTNSSILSNGCIPIDLPHNAFGEGEVPIFQRFPWQLPDRNNRIAVVGVPEAQSKALLEELQHQKEAQKNKSNRRSTNTNLSRQSSLSRTGSWNFHS